MNFQEFLKEWHDDSDFIKVFTSGSSGPPKEINLSKIFMTNSAKRTNDFFRIGEDSRLHSCVAADFIGGKMMAVRAEIANAYFSFEKPSNRPLQVLSPDIELDLVAVVPSQVPFIIDNINYIPKIRNLLIGGSSIHPELKSKIAASGLNAYESYGMTETASHIALRKINNENTPFLLLPNIQVALDENQCLIIKFSDGKEIITNDIADLVSEKEFFIRGRRDNIIISGGKKINPIEIESRLSHLIEVPFLITGVPDEKWGEKVVLVIEGQLDKRGLIQKISNVLEKWEKPKEIYYVSSLPRTPNGKIKRIKGLSSLSFSVPDNNLFF